MDTERFSSFSSDCERPVRLHRRRDREPRSRLVAVGTRSERWDYEAEADGTSADQSYIDAAIILDLGGNRQ